MSMRFSKTSMQFSKTSCKSKTTYCSARHRAQQEACDSAKMSNMRVACRWVPPQDAIQERSNGMRMRVRRHRLLRVHYRLRLSKATGSPAKEGAVQVLHFNKRGSGGSIVVQQKREQ